METGNFSNIALLQGYLILISRGLSALIFSVLQYNDRLTTLSFINIITCILVSVSNSHY